MRWFASSPGREAAPPMGDTAVLPTARAADPTTGAIGATGAAGAAGAAGGDGCWRAWVGLAVPGLLAVCVQVALSRVANQRPQSFLAFAGLYLLAFLLYAWALWVLRRIETPAASAPGSASASGAAPRRPGWPLVAGILLIALAMRLAALPGAPLFEDDHHRYLWDGRVAAHGINPYRYAPNDPALDAIRDAHGRAVNYPEIPTIYPPLAQGFFRLVHALGGSLLALKGAVLALEAAGIGLTLLLLRRVGLPMTRVLILAWCPLLVKAFANSAHMDALVVLCLVALLHETIAGRGATGALALAAGILAKWWPLLLWPFLWRRWRIREHALCAGVVAAGWALYAGPAWRAFWAYHEATDPARWRTWTAAASAVARNLHDAATYLFGGLMTYARYWEYNDSLFRLITRLRFAIARWSGDLPPDAPIDGAALADAIHGQTKLLVIGILLALALWRAPRRDAGPLVVLHGAFVLILGLLLLAPTVDAWYLSWLLPLLCLFPRRGVLLWTGTVVVAYLFIALGGPAGGAGTARLPAAWIDLLLAVEYVPVYAALLWEWRRRYRAGTPATALA